MESFGNLEFVLVSFTVWVPQGSRPVCRKLISMIFVESLLMPFIDNGLPYGTAVELFGVASSIAVSLSVSCLHGII